MIFVVVTATDTDHSEYLGIQKTKTETKKAIATLEVVQGVAGEE